MLNNINEKSSETVRPTPLKDTTSKTQTKDSSNSKSTASEGANHNTQKKSKQKLKQTKHKRTPKGHDVRDILDKHSRRLRRNPNRIRTNPSNFYLKALNASISNIFNLPGICDTILNNDELNTLLDDTINELNPLAYSATKTTNPNICI